MMRPVVLSVGTSHPWNIAGIGLDLALAETLGVRVVTVVAAVSAQDDTGLHALHAVPPEMLEAQIACVPWQSIAAIRVGALASAESVRVVARMLREHRPLPAVVDPVLVATLGGALADEPTTVALRDDLATVDTVILTPNLDEAAVLLKHRVIGMNELTATAQALQRRGPRAVLLKGGHLSGDPTDMLATAEDVEVFTDSRLPWVMRGTGCTLAMAIASSLAHAVPLRDAVGAARVFVRARIAEQRRFSGLTVAY